MSSFAGSAQTRAVVELGSAAYDALSASGGAAYPVERFGRTGYFHADNRLILVGHNRNLLHPRAVIVSDAFGASALWLDISACQIWQPRKSCRLVRGLANRCRSLVVNLVQAETPKGFGTLLSRTCLPAPFQSATTDVIAVAEACFHDDSVRGLAAGQNLLGAGFGLTPSGDDYTGAALFARLQLSSVLRADTGRWNAVAEILARDALTRSHPISATLLRDMTNGQGFAPLHELSNALIEDAPAITSIAAARRLIGIGHSSGWDMFAGLIGAWTGALKQPPEENDECCRLFA